MMRKHVLKPGPGDPVDDVATKMTDRQVGCVGVVEDDHLVGILTQDGLILLLSKEIKNLSPTVQADSPPEEWGRSY